MSNEIIYRVHDKQTTNKAVFEAARRTIYSVHVPMAGKLSEKVVSSLLNKTATAKSIRSSRTALELVRDSANDLMERALS